LRKLTFTVSHWIGVASSFDFIGQEAVKRIREWHLKAQYNDIGYHRIIDRNGSIFFGRPISVIGAHAGGFNSESIGILYMYGSKDREMTKESIESGARLLASFNKEYGIPLSEKSHVGHNDLMPTDCPGIIKKYLPEIVKRAKEIANINSENIKLKENDNFIVNESIRKTKVIGLNGSEIEGLLINSQNYIHIRDIANLFPGTYVEWDNINKIVKILKRGD
jgi:hypothetical protein